MIVSYRNKKTNVYEYDINTTRYDISINLLYRAIKEPIKVELNRIYLNHKRKRIRYKTYMDNITNLSYITTMAPTIKE